LPHLEKAAEIQPKLTRNRLNLGACFVGLRQYDKAESLLQEIVGEHSKFPMAHYHLGLLYEEQKRWGEAKKAYSEEVELYPENFMARFNLGKLLYRLGDREGYLEQMQEVIRIAPKKAEGYLFLARGLLQKPGDVENVLELIQQGLSLAESSELKALGYYLLADIYTRKNQPGKVQEALKKARSYTSK
jgi:tetratricopeptide (TPR) repeat protein